MSICEGYICCHPCCILLYNQRGGRQPTAVVMTSWKGCIIWHQFCKLAYWNPNFLLFRIKKQFTEEDLAVRRLKHCYEGGFRHCLFRQNCCECTNEKVQTTDVLEKVQQWWVTVVKPHQSWFWLRSSIQLNLFFSCQNVRGCWGHFHLQMVHDIIGVLQRGRISKTIIFAIDPGYPDVP